MPIKLKPSVKKFDRRTGLTTIEHYYMKSQSLDTLKEILNKDSTSPKLKQKVKNEIVRRNLLSSRV